MTNGVCALKRNRRKSRPTLGAECRTCRVLRGAARRLLIAAVCLLVPSVARAQEFSFPAGEAGDAAAVERAMPALAVQLIAAYREEGRATYLDNLFRLQIVAGRYGEASQTLAKLRGLNANPQSPQTAAYNVQDQIFARAKVIEGGEGVPFEQAFQRAFREQLRALDDRVSALVIRTFTVPEQFLRPDFENAAAKQKGKNAVTLADALALVRAYQIDEEFRAFAPLVEPLIAEDDGRRYVTEKNVRVKTPDGATICAHTMRPKGAAERLPTLLEFTIYNPADPTLVVRDMRRTASNGYASVVGFTRGRACSPDQTVPYEHDGADAAALVDWVTRQGWSDGRVGMYGGSYSGFTPWAAAKFMPKGLKAIMVGAAAAPGVDVPMEGNIVWNFIYPWPFYTTTARTDNDALYNDRARWQKLESAWYESGRAFRELDKIDGLPNPVWQRWVAHPAYDAYWQGMIPYKEEFARVTVPVLNTAGYYFGGPGAAVYYFKQHLRYNPKAEHYLLIGPYEHFQAQRGTRDAFGRQAEFIFGYRRDPAALVDLVELRYQWFDYVFKGAHRPAILRDRVNYEVTGANVWKHAPSIEAMSASKLRLHLTATKQGAAYRLGEGRPARDESVAQTVNLADRSDTDRPSPGGGVLDKEVDSANGLVFVSDPFDKPVEMSGLFSGLLDFTTNKKDFDFEIDLYKLTPAGEYLQLAPYWARASYVRDRTERHLLRPGARERLNFSSIRLMSSRFEPGSRVVAVLRVIKESGREINYGSGKEVADETIRDAGAPLEIKWHGDSYLDLPVVR
jgi:putative CocE/NonD family hydrolase